MYGEVTAIVMAREITRLRMEKPPRDRQTCGPEPTDPRGPVDADAVCRRRISRPCPLSGSRHPDRGSGGFSRTEPGSNAAKVFGVARVAFVPCHPPTDRPD